ncbi:preprotein translocase subunit SecG [Mycoplasma sp. SG1]|uniref:preprotein translocase subunit SecG n=1 Tax=Mycoplasma sp. SG1 TaxID=2810348 RepID=UPI0020255A63|nr:preprotein translocase subunit SecG [Mycoplasma sp. SG1]URM53004.1 preprotein translocase subunit SecG [Mycoplasma sp. SG1]
MLNNIFPLLSSVKQGVGITMFVIIILLAIILIILVLLQGGKTQGLGSTLTGATDSNLFREIKQKESDKKFKRITSLLIASFLIICLVFVILLHFQIISF